jgi:hypothetical protein
MKAYLALVVIWAIAARCLFVGYYGMRFPEKYMENPWTRPRGLIGNSVEGTAAFEILFGCILAVSGVFILHEILAGHAN